MDYKHNGNIPENYPGKEYSSISFIKTPKEVIDKRTEFSKTFDKGNGRFSLVASRTPIHYLDEYGKYQDIDVSIVDGKIEKNIYKVEILKDRIGYSIVSRRDGSRIDVRLDKIGSKDITYLEPVFEGNKAIWIDIDTDVDFIIEFRPYRVRCWKKLKSSSAAKDITFTVIEDDNKKELRIVDRVVGYDAKKLQTKVSKTNTTEIKFKTEFTQKDVKQYQIVQVFEDKVIVKDDKTRVKSESSEVSYPVMIDADVEVVVDNGADDGVGYKNLGHSCISSSVQTTFTATGFYDSYDTFDPLNTYHYRSAAGCGVYNNWYQKREAYTRFTGITIPQGATIDDATLGLHYVLGSNDGWPLKFYGVDENNPNAPTAVGDIIGKTTGLASNVVSTSLQYNQTGSPSGADAYSLVNVDVKPIVQELVNNYDYSNEAMLFFVRMDKRKTSTFSISGFAFYAYDWGTIKAPELIINYTADKGYVLGDISLSWTEYGAGTQYDETISDASTFQDAASAVLTANTSATDSFILQDSSTPANYLSTALTDSFVLQDATTLANSITSTAVDSLVVDDASTVSNSITVSGSDSFVLDDSSTGLVYKLEIVSDSIIFDDASTNIMLIPTFASDSLVVGDASSNTMTINLSTSAGGSATKTFGDNSTNDYTNVTKDAGISSYYAHLNYNFGANPTGAVSKEYDDLRLLLAFDLSDLSNVSVNSAKLKIKANTAGAGSEVSLYKVKRLWNEGDNAGSTAQTGEVTWNSAQRYVDDWASAGCNDTTSDRAAVATDTITVSGAEVYLTADVSSDVQDMIDNPSTNYGWLFIHTSGSYTDIFYTSEADDGNRPYLEVSYTISGTGDRIVFNDSVSVSNTLTTLSGLDSFILQDTASNIKALIEQVSDSFTVNDAATAIASLITTALDSLVLDDSSSNVNNIEIQIGDSFTVSDASTGIFTFNTTASDGLYLSETVAPGVQITYSVLDSAVFSDNSTPVSLFTTQVSDTISLDDTTIGVVNATVLAQDAVEFQDAAANIITFITSISDGFTLSASVESNALTALFTFVAREKTFYFTLQQRPYYFVADPRVWNYEADPRSYYHVCSTKAKYFTK